MDFRTLKKLSIGGVELKQLFINGIQAWKAITFKNLVPESTDTDGSIFNKTGYKDNARLGSNGSVSSSAQAGSVTTGFIPCVQGNTDIIRIKDAVWLRDQIATGHYYLHYYDANKNQLAYISSSQYDAETTYQNMMDISYDANTGITTFIHKNPNATGSITEYAKRAKYFRLNAYGKGADLIVTVNEEIA